MSQNEKGNNPNSGKKRDSMRVSVNFPIQYAPISQEELESLKGSFCLHSTSDREGRPSPTHDGSTISVMERDIEKSLGRGFLQMWRLIDRKLNMIYEAMAKEKTGRWGNEATCVEIGGSGLKMLASAEELKPGRHLKLRISPLTYPPFAIEVLTTVNRTEKKEEPGKPPVYEVVMTFNTINSDDQEALFTYLFKRQREIIRSGNE